MNYLLDTHTLLWYLNDDPLLSAYSKTLIENPDHTITASIASFWEMTIKHALGKLRLETTIQEIYDATTAQEISILPIEIDHLTCLYSVPFHHRDPFDRLLIAQAMTEDLVMISKDQHLTQYDIQLVWKENDRN